MLKGKCRSEKWEVYLYGDMTIKVERAQVQFLDSVTCPLLLRQGMGSRRAENCGGLRSCSSWRDGMSFLGRVHRYTARGFPRHQGGEWVAGTPGACSQVFCHPIRCISGAWQDRLPRVLIISTTHTTQHHNTQHHTETETERHRDRDRQKQTETEKEDRNRERQRETEKERQDKTRKQKRRQDKKREDETIKEKKREDERGETRKDERREERGQEERRLKTREEKREDKKREEARQEKRQDEREKGRQDEEKMKGRMKEKMKRREKKEKMFFFSKKCFKILKPAR